MPPGEEDVKNPAWLNDPLLYHNRGNTSFTGENSLYGDFFGLDDLWTERREVVEGMVDIYSFWIEEFGVDGFRIDTTKHVNMEFWQAFGPDILDAAEARGIDDFFAFGEVFDQQFGSPFMSQFSTEGKLQSTIDFGFQLAARGFAVAERGRPTTCATSSPSDDCYTDADSNAYAMPTFLGNHDMGRIGYFLQRVDQPGASDAELLARSQLAHALMFFARGPAGRLLRRRAGLHRRRRRQGRPRGHVRQRGRRRTRTTTSSAPTRPRPTTTSTATTRCTETIRDSPDLDRRIRRCARGAQIHRVSTRRPRRLRLLPHRPRRAGRVRRRAQQQRGAGHRRGADLLAAGRAVRARLAPAGTGPRAGRRSRPAPAERCSVTVPALGYVIYQADASRCRPATPRPASTSRASATATPSMLGTNTMDGHAGRRPDRGRGRSSTPTSWPR